MDVRTMLLFEAITLAATPLAATCIVFDGVLFFKSTSKATQCNSQVISTRRTQAARHPWQNTWPQITLAKRAPPCTHGATAGWSVYGSSQMLQCTTQSGQCSRSTAMAAIRVVACAHNDCQSL